MPDRTHRSLSGRYRLIATIGEGGMGRVWHARDELLGRDVAAKEITHEGMTATELGDLRERAIREARAIAQINHPSVVRIFDVVDEGDNPWIIMELVPSRSLHEVINQNGPLTPEDAARIGLAILSALRAAHRLGILHRDVKPANVLLTADGRVVLTDFGLATLAGDSSMTRTGVVVGSPSYLAPERALDKPADARGDLWSLGATLFAAVEGRAPYQKSSPMATLSALMTEPPSTPERAGVLQATLAALLRRNPDERADADETERLLREASASSTPLAVPAQSGPTLPQPSPAADTATTSPTTITRRTADAAIPRRRWLISAVAAVALASGLAVAQPFTAVTSSGSSAPSVQPSLAGSAPVARSRGSAAPVATTGKPAATTPTAARTTSAPAATSPPVGGPKRSTATAAAPAPTTTKAPVAAVPAVGNQIWNHGTGTCLHLPGVGREVQMWQCNGSDNQRFHIPGDGTLRVLGQCVVPESAAIGSRIRATACSGSVRQRFSLNAARDLVHLSTDMCVDVTDWNSSNGAPAQIWTCAGTDNQKWN